MIAGIDEAGRGAVLGPLVVCLAEFPENKLSVLAELGVKDSKLLTRKKRLDILKRIKTKFYYEIVSASELVNWMETKSLTQIELELMASLTNKCKSNKVIIDCPSSGINNFTRTFKKLIIKERELIIEHKADLNYKIVALASIAAKEKREALLDTLRLEDNDFGSGYPSDPKTKKYLDENPNIKIIRTNWKTWTNKSQTKLI